MTLLIRALVMKRFTVNSRRIGRRQLPGKVAIRIHSGDESMSNISFGPLAAPRQANTNHGDVAALQIRVAAADKKFTELVQPQLDRDRAEQTKSNWITFGAITLFGAVAGGGIGSSLSEGARLTGLGVGMGVGALALGALAGWGLLSHPATNSFARENEWAKPVQDAAKESIAAHIALTNARDTAVFG